MRIAIGLGYGLKTPAKLWWAEAEKTPYTVEVKDGIVFDIYKITDTELPEFAPYEWQIVTGDVAARGLNYEPDSFEAEMEFEDFKAKANNAKDPKKDIEKWIKLIKSLPELIIGLD